MGAGTLSVVPLQGDWNSTVWLVRTVDGRRYVAKLAGAEERTGFRSGLRVARRAAERGFRSGPPVPLPDGSLEVCAPGGAVALLEYVPGRRANVDSVADLRRIGGALAHAHACPAAEVECLDQSLVWPWPWVDAAVARTPMPAGVRDAVRRALDDARRATETAGLVVQVVHGDPAFDAVILDEARVEDVPGCGQPVKKPGDSGDNHSDSVDRAVETSEILKTLVEALVGLARRE